MSKVVIGLGTGRSGTRSLARILNYHENIDCTHENRHYMLQPSNHGYLGIKSVIDSLNDDIATCNEDYLGDVCHNHIYRISNYISEFGKDLKIICIYRNPSETAISWLRKYKSLSACRYEDKEKIIKRFGIKHYQVWADYFLKYYGLSSDEAWYEYIKWYHNEMESLADLAFHIWLPDLNDDSSLEAMFKYLNLEPQLLPKDKRKNNKTNEV